MLEMVALALCWTQTHAKYISIVGMPSSQVALELKTVRLSVLINRKLMAV